MNLVDVQKINHAPEKRPTDVYIGDLLSCVMAHIEEGSLWLTTQINMNVIAIGHLHELAGIIFVEGMVPDQTTIEKAEEVGIALYSYAGSAYTLAVQIHEMGLDHVL